MIDLRKIYQYEPFKTKVIEFEKTLGEDCFKVSNCEHTMFKKTFLKFTKDKCSICEQSVDPNDDVDHFRPHAKYLFLKCCYKNYILMCSLCNRAKYKGSEFPIDGKKATKISELKNEKALLINPCHDDIYKFFELEFTVDINNKYIVNINPSSKLKTDSFEFKRAEETIKIFGLNNCKNDDSKAEVMQRHFSVFVGFARAFQNYFEITSKFNNDPEGITPQDMDDYDKFEKEFKVYKKSDEKQHLRSFGFYKFIIRNKFVINLLEHT